MVDLYINHEDIVMKNFLISALAGIALFPFIANAENIGSMVTERNFMGSNSTIEIEAIDDPDITNIVCYLSYPRKGGMMADIGLGENPSNSSIACRALGPIDDSRASKEPTEVFKQSQSMFFKAMSVTRFYDGKRKAWIYLTTSRKVISGSKKSSISVVVPPRK